MPAPSTSARFERNAVPLVVFLLVAIAVLVVPPLVLGEVSTRTYAITAAVVILAVGAVMPYAILVAFATLPLWYADVASFAAPETEPDGSHSISAVAALRHVVAGVAYVLGAAVVGAIGLGAQIGLGTESTVTFPVLQPSFLYLGGLLVGAVFVGLQLWRYDTALGVLDRRTIVGTVALGILLALSPVVAFWLFDGAI